MDIKKLESMIDLLCETADDLYAGHGSKAQENISDVVTGVNETYLFYINNHEKYEKLGVDIPSDVLLSQMGNLLESIDAKDLLKLADTLEYEIKEGILFFIDIEKQI